MHNRLSATPNLSRAAYKKKVADALESRSKSFLALKGETDEGEPTNEECKESSGLDHSLVGGA